MAEGLDAMTALRLAREQIAIAREHGIEGVVAPPKRRRIINEKPHEFAQQPHLKKSVVIDNADTVSKVEEMVANPTPASNPRTEEDYDKLFYQPSVPHMDQDTIRQKFMGANSESGTPMHSEPVKSTRVAPRPFRLSDDEQNNQMLLLKHPIHQLVFKKKLLNNKLHLNLIIMLKCNRLKFSMNLLIRVIHHLYNSMKYHQRIVSIIAS